MSLRWFIVVSDAVRLAVLQTHHECSGQTAHAVRQWNSCTRRELRMLFVEELVEKELAPGLFPQRQASNRANYECRSIEGCLRPAEAHYELGLPSLLLRAGLR